VAEKKQLTLEVTEAIVDIIGEAWLLGPMIVPEDQKPVPLDRYFKSGSSIFLCTPCVL